MKKILTLLVIITTLLFNISNVYALDISIKEITVYDKNDTITVSNISSDGLTIGPKITFNNVNDYVTLKVTFKGKDISKYKINNISDNNKSEYIKTSYSSKEDLTGPVFITLEYYKLARSNVSLNNISITLDLENENGEEITINYNDNSNQDVSSSAQTGTLSYILTPLILITISLFLIKYYSKNNNISTMIILLLLIIPITVLASEKIALIINTDNIQIKVAEEVKPVTEPEDTTPKTYKVYLYPNGGTGITDGQKFEYTETTLFTEFPKVTRTNCTLDGWNVGSANGTKYYTDVRPSDDGSKLYARWNCNTSSSSSSGSSSVSNYKNAGSAAVNLNEISCPYYSSRNIKLSTIYINATIATQFKEALRQLCNYLQENKSVYNNPTASILSAGTYAETNMYPHQWGMGVDLFSNWKYVYNGKTYYPYSSYADSTNYRKFICEVCNGDYTCKQNLNYQIYERIFKPLGFCWGGYWKEKYFDPMHFEYDIGNGNCRSAPQITINCS